MRRSVIVCLVLLVMVASLSACGKKPVETPGPGVGDIPMPPIGQPVVLLETVMGGAGGTVTVPKSAVAVPGLKIEVPPGAFASDMALRVSSSAINSLSLGPLLKPVTPLISVDCAEHHAAQLLTVTVPFSLADDEFAVAFFYDPDTEVIEGIPTLAQDSQSISFVTTHFSSFLVAAGKREDLAKPELIETGFMPGQDDWQFANYGSYATPGGHCLGQAMAALWYYRYHHLRGEPQLWGLLDNDGNTATPLFWQDDTLAYRFVSSIQVDAVDTRTVSVLEKYADLFISREDAWLYDEPENHWLAIKTTMARTGRPQLVVVTGTRNGKFQAHALIAHKIEGNKVYFADPNFPGALDRFTTFAEGAWAPYNSAANRLEIEAGKGTSYDRFLWIGELAFLDESVISLRWDEVSDKSLANDIFDYPMVTLDKGKVLFDNRVEFTIAMNDETDLQNLYLSLYWPMIDSWSNLGSLAVNRSFYQVNYLTAGANLMGVYLYDSAEHWYHFQWIDLFLERDYYLEAEKNTVAPGELIRVSVRTASGVEPPEMEWSVYDRGRSREESLHYSIEKDLTFTAPDYETELEIEAVPEGALFLGQSLMIQVVAATEDPPEPPISGDKPMPVCVDVQIKMRPVMVANPELGNQIQGRWGSIPYMPQLEPARREGDEKLNWQGLRFTGQATGYYDAAKTGYARFTISGELSSDHLTIAWLELQVDYKAADDDWKMHQTTMRFEGLPLNPWTPLSGGAPDIRERFRTPQLAAEDARQYLVDYTFMRQDILLKERVSVETTEVDLQFLFIQFNHTGF